MNISPQAFLFIFIVLVMVSALTVGIFFTSNDRQGMQHSDSIMEVLIWGGGFIIYAVIDYLVFMH